MILGLLQDFSHWILLTLLEDDLFYGHYLILVSGFRNKSWATYFSITNMGHNVIISTWGGGNVDRFWTPSPMANVHNDHDLGNPDGANDSKRCFKILHHLKICQK